MFLLLIGCAIQSRATCQGACDALYSDQGCDIQRAGRTESELDKTCMDECMSAMTQRGDLGSYDPYRRTGSDQSVSLDNKAQAELWAQCVQETSCEQLTDGFCAPVW